MVKNTVVLMAEALVHGKGSHRIMHLLIVVAFALPFNYFRVMVATFVDLRVSDLQIVTEKEMETLPSI